MRSVRPTVGFGPGSGFPLPSKLRDADVIRVAGSHLARFQQPRNLAALISLYEANYRRLVRLVPDLDHLEGSVVSRVAGTLDLYLGVLERRPYTTTLGLTYRFDTSSGLVLDPNARVCVYHDVRAVELLGCCRRSHGPGPPPDQGETHARNRPKVEYESVSAQVVEVLHSSGASFPGLYDPGGGRRVSPVARLRLVRLQDLKPSDAPLLPAMGNESVHAGDATRSDGRSGDRRASAASSLIRTSPT